MSQALQQQQPAVTAAATAQTASSVWLVCALPGAVWRLARPQCWPTHLQGHRLVGMMMRLLMRGQQTARWTQPHCGPTQVSIRLRTCLHVGGYKTFWTQHFVTVKQGKAVAGSCSVLQHGALDKSLGCVVLSATVCCSPSVCDVCGLVQATHPTACQAAVATAAAAFSSWTVRMMMRAVTPPQQQQCRSSRQRMECSAQAAAPRRSAVVAAAGTAACAWSCSLL